ncbi:hypothetical protein EVB78_158 [Rhizobium phage RHph_N1_15]|nr:hypothetical protein EVB77_158 [Rhizobium phage RHph_N1_10]QIG69360.1 hypothetical protein EVB78_158 [Rhizobium phage RHph_N1_15]QIG75220.1 hypothetical protein EVC15_158 [Rhizobium phage RHph_N2_6]
MSEATDLWKNLELPAELRQYMTLSPLDVNTLTLAAMQAADPKARLQEMLIELAQGRKTVAERHMAERMAEDKRRIQATHQWPLPWLPVKKQPWIATVSDSTQYGRIEREDLLTVLVDGEQPKLYASLDELVAYWSVD